MQPATLVAVIASKLAGYTGDQRPLREFCLLARSILAAYLHPVQTQGECWVPGGPRGLQNRRRDACAWRGRFDSYPLRFFLVGFVLLLSGAARARDRSFLFTYAVTITHLPQDKLARLWMPMPQSSVDQQIQIVSEDLPAEPKIATESKCGNRIAYIESHPRADGTLPIRVVYRVTRHEIGEDDPSVISSGEPYLQPDALVPVGGKPQALLANHPLPSDQLKLARVLYDLVDDHMQYRKDQPGWGRGDACWAADSGFGNCTDFHSLFISLARTRGIPCKFEIGFPIPATRGKGDVSGYHCWVKFKPIGRGWIPADISEAKLNPSRRDYFFGHLDENRVAFSEGRDLTLVPKQQGPAINFFVYPYVEVDRKPFAAQNVEKHFSYQDLSAEKM